MEEDPYRRNEGELLVSTAMMRALGFSAVVLGVTALIDPNEARGQGGAYVNFETIPTRALDLSPNGQRLFATNTPDGRLEIFDVMADGSLRASASVSVGLDPIAVAARTDTEVWVVNHLSDSVSIVDVSGSPRVVRTLLVGDEPRDVAFAGQGGNRAFITAARRGQNHPGNTVNETQVPGVGRADVWVFDVNNLGNSVGGTPLTILRLFSDKPGALGVTADGSRVFVSVFTSGNETTTINDSAVCANNGLAGGVGGGGAGIGGIANSNAAVTRSSQNSGPCALERGGMSPGGVPAPNQTPMGAQNPRTGVLVKFDRASGAWRDQASRDWRAAVPFSLPDNDVFTIDALADPPRQVGVFQHVGTLNKSVAVHPTNGRAYVATIEAINLNRFISVPRIGAFPNPNQIGGAAEWSSVRVADRDPVPRGQRRLATSEQAHRLRGGPVAPGREGTERGGPRGTRLLAGRKHLVRGSAGVEQDRALPDGATRQ
jgi:YVTN family beta-propeller protein